ncbi:MAG TPA: hypothetical protein VN654_20320 [Vicinamibacterales bacterium]|jgi:hypothetical protein|nr:hypothetical protein [Vicinamibacterales bacterium]
MLKWLGVGIVLVVVIYLAVMFALYRGNPDFLSIDSCLDGGGRWNYATRMCEH